MRLTIDGKTYTISLEAGTVTVDGSSFDVRIEGQGQSLTAFVDGRPYQVELPATVERRCAIRVAGRAHEVLLGDRLPAPGPRPRLPSASSHATSGTIVSPMAGRILRLAVAAGDRVDAGDLLFILEAMKMENEIRAPRAGIVRRIEATEGQRVIQGTVVLVVE